MTYLHGRAAIANYLNARYGFGTVTYVSAMVRAGLPLDPGYTTTPARIETFFRDNPNFRQRTAWKIKRKANPTVRTL